MNQPLEPQDSSGVNYWNLAFSVFPWSCLEQKGFYIYICVYVCVYIYYSFYKMCLKLESLKRFGLMWGAKFGSVNGFLGQTMSVWHLITLLENKMHDLLPTSERETYRNIGRPRIT